MKGIFFVLFLTKTYPPIFLGIASAFSPGRAFSRGFRQHIFFFSHTKIQKYALFSLIVGFFICRRGGVLKMTFFVQKYKNIPFSLINNNYLSSHSIFFNSRNFRSYPPPDPLSRTTVHAQWSGRGGDREKYSAFNFLNSKHSFKCPLYEKHH